MRKRRLAATSAGTRVTILFVFVLLAISCGNGDEASSDPTTTTIAATTTTTQAPTTTTTQAATPTTEGSVGAAGNPQRLCEIDEEFAAIPGPPQSAAELLEINQLARVLLDEAIIVAPDEIRAAIETTSEGRAEWHAAMEAAIEAQPDVFADGDFEFEEVNDGGRLRAALEENFFPGNVTADAEAAWEGWNAQNCSG